MTTKPDKIYVAGYIDSIIQVKNTTTLGVFSYETANDIYLTLQNKYLAAPLEVDQHIDIKLHNTMPQTIIDTQHSKIIYDTKTTNIGKKISFEDYFHVWHEAINIRTMYKLLHNTDRMRHIMKMYLDMHPQYKGDKNIFLPKYEKHTIELSEFLENARNIAYYYYILQAHKYIYQHFYALGITPTNAKHDIIGDNTINFYAPFERIVKKIPGPYYDKTSFDKAVFDMRAGITKS